MQKEFLQEIVPELDFTGIAPPFKLFRYDRAEDRYYFRFLSEGSKGYLSVTSFIKKILPTSPFLINWLQAHGEEGAKYISNMRAEYGTQTHILTTEMERTGRGDWDEIRKYGFEAAINAGYKSEALEWEAEMVNDVFSYLVFRKEREVETIAAEFPICSDEHGLAGMIDRVVRLKFGKTKVNAIIDYKSGRKGFWDSHKIQLHCYMQMWNEWFGDLFPVTHCFNLAPAADALKAKSRYKMENQTDATLTGESQPIRDYIGDLMASAITRGMVNPPNSHFELMGSFDLETFNPDDHIFEQKI